MSANIVATQNGSALYVVPGFSEKPMIPAVMVDGAGHPIGSVDRNDGTAAVMAVQLGAPVQLLYSEAATTRTADGNVGSLTSTPSTQAITGLFLAVNMTTVNTPGDLIVTLEQQDGNGAWQPIGSTTGLTAVGKASLSVGSGFSVPAMLNGGPYRISWTLGGGSFTFQLSLQGR